MSINARSVYANIEKIEILCHKINPNIVFCTETRITDELNTSEYNIENGDSIVCYSQSRATGGVVAYIKKPLKYKVILNEFTEQYIWILSIEILECAMAGIYSAIYRSPAHYLKKSLETIDNDNKSKNPLIK